MSDWDRQTTPGSVEGPQWVSAAEAADVAGVTPGTVRYWARNGLIVSEVVDGPAGEKTLVRLDEVLQHARQEGPSRAAPPGPRHSAGGPAAGGDVVTDLPARTSELAPILKSIPEIMAQLTAATDRAARAETKVEFLSAQLADLRRRLAEAEASGASAPPAEPPSVVTLPEEWASPPQQEAPAVEETRDESPVQGWPSPPAETLRDEPAEEREPGPDSIDWTTRAAGTSAAPPPEVEEPTDSPAPGISLDDIWNQPATPARSEPEEAPAPTASLDEIWNQPAPPRAEPEAEPGGVDWHEPAAPAAPVEEEAPARTRPANASIPEGDDFYGPRRRRWFKRRR